MTSVDSKSIRNGSRRTSSSGSFQAQLRAKAAAARFQADSEARRAEAERAIQEAERKLKVVELQIAADIAQVECEEFEKHLFPDEVEPRVVTFNVEQPELKLHDRVEEFLAMNPRQTIIIPHDDDLFDSPDMEMPPYSATSTDLPASTYRVSSTVSAITSQPSESNVSAVPSSQPWESIVVSTAPVSSKCDASQPSFMSFRDGYPTPVKSTPRAATSVSYIHTRGGTFIPPPPASVFRSDQTVLPKLDLEPNLSSSIATSTYAGLDQRTRNMTMENPCAHSHSSTRNSSPFHSDVSHRNLGIVTPDSRTFLENVMEECSKTNIQVAETLARAQLPRIDFTKFSGDPCMYTSWKRTALIQLNLGMSNTERLIRLSRMVEKDPAEIVKQYSDRFPNQARIAYEKAWEVLDFRYGRSSVVANALLAKLTDAKKFTESEYDALRKFADLCTSVSLQIKTLPGLQVLDYPMYLRPITGKLPLVFQRKWTDQAYRLLKKARKDGFVKEYPTFSEFAEFLDDLADKLCDPNLRPIQEHVKSAKRINQNNAKPGPRGQFGNSENRELKDKLPCPCHPDLTGEAAHSLSRCIKLRRLPATAQLEILKANPDFCRSCLERGHGSTCTAEIKCNKCDRRHYSFLHEACGRLTSSDRTPHSYSATTEPSVSTAICPAQRIHCKTVGDDLVTLHALHDSGSNVSLVTLNACEKLGLRQISDDAITLNVEVLGGDTISSSAHRYLIPIYDNDGNLLTSITAYAIEKIGSDLPAVDLTDALCIFGLQPDSEISYPSGSVHVLIGMDNAHVAPSTISHINGMVLAQSAMGKLIYGTHPSFGASSEISSYKITIKPSDLRLDLVPSLFSTDVLGISCVPKCGGCSCKQCPPDNAPHTLQERYEYEQIKSSMTLVNGIITASYPYVRDPSQLPDNYELALKRLCQTERSLAKDPSRAAKYQEQIDDMISRGILRLLTNEEEAAWNGAVQYLPHNDVLKPGSETTPTRLVFDPSAQYKGKAVNQFWGRGPCLMNDPVGILVRFREYPTAYAGDISKMYWCIHTRPVEWHLHRVLWRNMETDRRPDKYVIVRNSFGSGPAGTVAIAALNFLAERRDHDLPDATKVIKTQAFVDDIIDSTPTLADAERITAEIDQILAEGSFKIKKWTFVSPSSETPARGSAQLTQSDSVLGINWNTNDDEFYFVPRLNFNRKRKKVRQGPDLLPGQIFDLAVVPSLTKRMIISQVNSLYDPLGLLSPFIVELKFGVAKLWRYKDTLDWDTVIPEDHDRHWRQLFELFFQVSEIRFPRLLRPSNAAEPPRLVAFSDSSMISYCSALYVRWCTDDNVFARLIMAKTRMWPIEPEDYLSVARGELMGILLAKRLVATVLKECRFEFDEILYVTDSEIALAQINMNSHEFGVWTGSRVAEIRTGTNLSQFWFARSPDNPSADLCSRGTTDLALLDADSIWQRGPTWLYKPREEWPLTQNVKTAQPIPDLRAESLARRTLTAQLPPDPVTSGDAFKRVTFPLVQTIPCQVYNAIQTLGESPSFNLENFAVPRLELADFSTSQENFIASRFDLSRHDDFNLWLATTARVLHACSWKPGRGSFLSRLTAPDVIPPHEREIARLFWIRQAQRPLLADIKSGKYASLTPYRDDDGIWRINGRSRPTSSYQPILLSDRHPVSRLIVIAIHRRFHDGRSGTASRTRADYHILKVRRLAAQVRADCQLCTLREKRLLKVPMAPLPVSRLEPSYPFEHTSCDLFGPIPVKLEGRITRNKSFNDDKLKAYGVLFACLSTRAVHLGVMQGQDTDAFLLAFRRFIAIRGQPKTLYSDNGSQLVAADQELRQMVANWDSEELRRFGAENGMIWTFTSPGSPWANGITEALVKSVKRSLKFVLPPNALTILELQTVFSEVSELLNERPIGIGSKHFTGDDFDGETNSYICPNQLLLGRSSVTVPSGPFVSVPISHANRFLANQAVVTSWWKHWYSEYLPSLVSQTKWFSSDRHAKIGDIVQVRDLNPIRGDWNLAEIIDIRQSLDSVPRNVLLRYKNSHPGKNYKSVPYRTQWRDVKNLSLLVPVDQRSSSVLDPNARPFIPK